MHVTKHVVTTYKEVMMDLKLSIACSLGRNLAPQPSQSMEQTS